MGATLDPAVKAIDKAPSAGVIDTRVGADGVPDGVISEEAAE
jgi:hypothetical protein